MSALATSRVSVVVPVYNGARYLPEALASIESQGDRVGEILVVDDGSRDDSAGIARRWGGRVRCLEQHHAGIAAARNLGIREATCGILGLLDADDLWAPDSLAPRLAVLDGDASVDLVAGLVEQFVSPDSPDEVARRLRVPSGWMAGFLGGAMLVRRRVYDRFGDMDESLRSGEFIDWFVRVRDGGAVIRETDVRCLRRRVHAANHGRLRRDATVDLVRVARTALARRRAAAR